MPAASSGNILFSALVGKAETTAGTSPSFATGGRKFLVEPTGLITIGKVFEIGEERSVSLRNPIVATMATLTSNEPELSVSVPAVSIDEMSVWLGMAFAPTISGTVAPFTWTYQPTMGTASNSPTSYSFISMDAQGGTAAGGNAYLLNYCLPTEISITADRSGLTALSATLFAQNVAETTTNPAASTALPYSKFLSGRLWNVATGTALATGTFSDFQYALDFSLTMQTGIVRQAYLAGTTTFSTHAESGAIGGELSMTIQSNANASAKWFQKLGQQQFVKLAWTDGTYSATINTSIIVTEVAPIAGSEDGLTTMTVTGRLAYDPVAAASIKIVVENAISALP